MRMKRPDVISQGHPTRGKSRHLVIRAIVIQHELHSSGTRIIGILVTLATRQTLQAVLSVLLDELLPGLRR